MFILMLMTRNGKGYYVAMTENHTQSGNIGNYSEFQDDHQLSKSGMKITIFFIVIQISLSILDAEL